MRIFIIHARVRQNKADPGVDCLAICSDPNTPTAFILEDRTLLTDGDKIYSYNLKHYLPWSEFKIFND